MNIDQTLKKIASNLWFEWNADVHMLFRRVSPYVWSLFRRNLYRFLNIQSENPHLYRRRIMELLVDPEFFRLLTKVEEDFNRYLEPDETLVTRQFPSMAGKTVAYFSMEYGIDILPIYSGGLGILSGDHLRGASDAGLRMVGVGLFYLQGYYQQQVGLDGAMHVNYEPIVAPGKSVRDSLPLEPLRKAGSHEALMVEIPVENRKIHARVWRAKVGRTDLLLLDTNVPVNGVHDRHITRRLYASQKHYEEERRRRLEQEMVLGIGGVMALEGAGYTPSVYHLNEGHVAFAALAVIRHFMTKEGLSYKEARRQAAGIIGFTTHTPVPEGNECFDEQLVRRHLGPYLGGFLAHEDQEHIYNCARNHENAFDMTKLSLLLSGICRNGVSRLHGEVCRKMWGYAWGNHDPEGRDVPIDSITNAVHLPYWQKPLLRELIERHGGIDHVDAVPDEKIWALHRSFKEKLIEKIRERYAYQLIDDNLPSNEIHEKTMQLLGPDSFMIGFARRFAQYKRVMMFLEDEELFFRFLENAFRTYGRPVNVLFAGKPHPNNIAGQEQILKIYAIAGRLERRMGERDFKARLVFIPGYDIDMARYLEAGVDVWLNNPIRPMEASGTSGMKAGMNGVLNVSIPDGWVPEGIVQGENGWMFGQGTVDSSAADRRELFELLEKTILPCFFDRPDGVDGCPGRWVALMKNSIRTISKKFNTDRMMADYIEKMYLPAASQAEEKAVRRNAAEEVN